MAVQAMAKRAGAKGSSRAGRELARLGQERLQRAHKNWCDRHPALAAEEREIRQQLREQDDRFGHKVNGTPETHAKASVVRQGAMARLYRTGAITIQQWGASMEIAAAYEKVTMAAGVGTTWSTMERVDVSRSPQDLNLGGVWNEIAYSRWRRGLEHPGPVLAMIVEDRGLDAAARQYSMHKRRAKRLLIDALNAWARLHQDVRKTVDRASVAAAEAVLQ